jgi:hypothetical protein
MGRVKVTTLRGAPVAAIVDGQWALEWECDTGWAPAWTVTHLRTREVYGYSPVLGGHRHLEGAVSYVLGGGALLELIGQVREFEFEAEARGCHPHCWALYTGRHAGVCALQRYDVAA